MAQRGVANARFWGTHTGAIAGLLIAAQRRPGLIGALVLEGPVIPGTNPEIIAETITRARSIAAEEGPAAAVTDWLDNAYWFKTMRGDPEATREAEHRKIVGDFAAEPWLDQSTSRPLTGVEAAIRKIDIPVLIYNGADDHPAFHETARTLDGWIPSARRALVTAGGAFPAWERPDAVNDLVSGFLDGLSD